MTEEAKKMRDARDANELARADIRDHRVKDGSPVLAEHSIATLSSPFNLEDGRTLPAGAAGAVVGVWGGGKAYEVEFVHPFHAVVTVPAGGLSSADAM